MEFDEYKKIALELYAQLPSEKKRGAVIGISSSHPDIDTYDLATMLGVAFSSLDVTALAVDARIGDNLKVSMQDPQTTPLNTYRTAFVPDDEATLSPSTAQKQLASYPQTVQIKLVALDPIHEHAPAMMLGGCCTTILLAEQKKLSRTDKIDKAVQVIKNLGVAPAGFVLLS